MPKLILELDDGTREEYTTFFAVVVNDTGSGGEFRRVIAYDCRILVIGAMLKKAIIHASDDWDEFIKRTFPGGPPLAVPDKEALNKRIKWSSN